MALRARGGLWPDLRDQGDDRDSSLYKVLGARKGKACSSNQDKFRMPTAWSWDGGRELGEGGAE